MLPNPFWPLAEHIGFGQKCSDGSIGSDRGVCIPIAWPEPSQWSSFSPFLPLAAHFPESVHKSHWGVSRDTAFSVSSYCWLLPLERNRIQTYYYDHERD